jgi:hypothetical protein
MHRRLTRASTFAGPQSATRERAHFNRGSAALVVMTALVMYLSPKQLVRLRTRRPSTSVRDWPAATGRASTSSCSARGDHMRTLRTEDMCSLRRASCKPADFRDGFCSNREMSRVWALLLIAGCTEVANPLYCDEDRERTELSAT